MSRRTTPDTVAPSLASSLAWPALEGFEEATELSFERGVWGKAHGARTDFRWLAASDGFAAYERALARQLYLGPEDRPCRMFAWCCLGHDAVALTAYPSPAADAAGRRGFLEKQVLAWTAVEGLPSAAVALSLLALAEGLDESAWWPRRAQVDWSRPAARFRLGPTEHPPSIAGRGTLVGREALAGKVAAALRSLVEVVPGEEALARLYGALLAEQRPARLLGLRAPLPSGALAALLLPLSRSLADHISVAGWLPSSRIDLRTLGRQWDLVAWPPGVGTGSASAADSEPPEEAWAAARALLAGDPTLLPPGGLGLRSSLPTTGEPRAKSRANGVPASEVPASEIATTNSEPSGSPPEVAEALTVVPEDAGPLLAADAPAVDAPVADAPVAETADVIDWDRLMLKDWRGGTNQLIEKGCWETWRRRAQLQEKGERQVAMAWMRSPVWARSGAPTPTWQAWEMVLEDLASLDVEQVGVLLSGPDGRPTWPWLPGRETEQVAGLAKKVYDSAARDLLRRGLERESSLRLRRLLDELLADTDPPPADPAGDPAADAPTAVRQANPLRPELATPTGASGHAETHRSGRWGRSGRFVGFLLLGLSVFALAVLVWRLAQGGQPAREHPLAEPIVETTP